MLQKYQTEAMKKTMGGLTNSPITVHKAYVAWQSPTKEDFKMWRIIAEHHGQLTWLHTYDQDLIKDGTHVVEFYQGNYGQRCVRKPRKDI